MPLPLEVNTGYLNRDEWLARVILSLVSDRVVYFDLTWPDCQLLAPRSSCTRQQFRRWANRQMAAAELGQIPTDLRQERQERLAEEARILAENLDTAYLVGELENRGYRVVAPAVAQVRPARTRRLLVE